MQFSVWVALSLCVFVCTVIWGKTVENAVATAEGKSFVFCYAKFYYINITEWLSSCSFASPFSPPINKRPFRLPARKVNRVPSPATLFVIYVAFLLKVTRFPPKGYIVCKKTSLSMSHTISMKLACSSTTKSLSERRYQIANASRWISHDERVTGLRSGCHFLHQKKKREGLLDGRDLFNFSESISSAKMHHHFARKWECLPMNLVGV